MLSIVKLLEHDLLFRFLSFKFVDWDDFYRAQRVSSLPQWTWWLGIAASFIARSDIVNVASCWVVPSVNTLAEFINKVVSLRDSYVDRRLLYVLIADDRRILTQRDHLDRFIHLSVPRIWLWIILQMPSLGILCISIGRDQILRECSLCLVLPLNLCISVDV